jgi:hypothetical protein
LASSKAEEFAFKYIVRPTVVRALAVRNGIDLGTANVNSVQNCHECE